MTNLEFNEVILRTKTSLLWEELKKPITYPEPILKVIDWVERKKMKNAIFKKYFKALVGFAVGSFLLFAVPLLLAYPPYGKAALLALPPMFLITLSWMAGAWWAWDKAREIFLGITLGGVPLRMGVGMVWVVIAMHIPDISIQAFVFSMMCYWILFTIIELGMFLEFSRKIEGTPQQEPRDV